MVNVLTADIQYLIRLKERKLRKMKIVSFEGYVEMKDDKENRLYNSAKCRYQKCNIIIDDQKKKLDELVERNKKIHNKLIFKLRYVNLILMFVSILYTLYRVSIINEYSQVYKHPELMNELFRTTLLSVSIMVIMALIAGWGFLLRSEISDIEKEIAMREKIINNEQEEIKDILTSYYKTIKCPKCHEPMKIDVREMGICKNCGYIKVKGK